MILEYTCTECAYSFETDKDLGSEHECPKCEGAMLCTYKTIECPECGEELDVTDGSGVCDCGYEYTEQQSETLFDLAETETSYTARSYSDIQKESAFDDADYFDDCGNW